MKHLKSFNEAIDNLWYKIQLGINPQSKVSTVKMQRDPHDRAKYGHTNIDYFYIPEYIAIETYKRYKLKEGERVQSYERILGRGGFTMNELDSYYPNWKKELYDAESGNNSQSEDTTKYKVTFKLKTQ